MMDSGLSTSSTQIPLPPPPKLPKTPALKNRIPALQMLSAAVVSARGVMPFWTTGAWMSDTPALRKEIPALGIVIAALESACGWSLATTIGALFSVK